MTRSVGRSTWTTETIRAIDLREQDTVLVDGIWRELFDVWKHGDEPNTSMDNIGDLKR